MSDVTGEYRPESVFGEDSPIRPLRLAEAGDRTSKARLLLARTRRRDGAATWLRILDSGSMKPLVEGSCWGLIEWSGAQRGDVVLIDDPLGMLLSHRLIRLRADRRVLQIADAIDVTVPYSGYLIDEDRVLGRVVLLRRRGREYRLDGAWPRRVGRGVAWASEAVWRAVERGRPTAWVRILLGTQTVVRRVALLVLHMSSRKMTGEPDAVPTE